MFQAGPAGGERPPRRGVLILLVAAASACGSGGDPEPDGPAADVVTAGEERGKEDARGGGARTARGTDPVRRGGLPLDPVTAKEGDSLGSWELATHTFSRALPRPGDSVWVGRALFHGETTLTGRYQPHPEFPEVSLLCFHPDEQSSGRLPRLRGDDRISWFCFTNSEEAFVVLGPGGEEGRATIRVSTYQVNHELSDTFDTAVLVGVEAGGTFDTVPAEGGIRGADDHGGL